MKTCYNDKFFHKKWGGLGRPSRPVSDDPDLGVQMHPPSAASNVFLRTKLHESIK